MIVVVKPKDVVKTMEILKQNGETVFEIGKVIENKGLDVVIR